MKERLRTFLVECQSEEQLTLLVRAVRDGKVSRKGCRAVIVSRAAPRSGVRVVHAGDQSEKRRAAWLSMTPLDEAHDAYLAASPVDARRAEAAREAFLQAVEARVRLEQVEIPEAKRRMGEAAAEVVRTHGRAGNVLIGGVEYHPGHNGVQVTLIPKMGSGRRWKT